MNLTACASLLPQELCRAHHLKVLPFLQMLESSAISCCSGCRAQMNPACPLCVLLLSPGLGPALQPCPKWEQAEKQGASGVCHLQFPSAPVKTDPSVAAAQLNGPYSVFFTSKKVLLQVSRSSYCTCTKPTSQRERGKQSKCLAGLG